MDVFLCLGNKQVGKLDFVGILPRQGETIRWQDDHDGGTVRTNEVHRVEWMTNARTPKAPGQADEVTAVWLHLD